MKKKSSDRLAVVLKLAKLRQQRSAEQLGERIKSAEAQRQQMTQLKGYQQDYSTHFKQMEGQALSAEQLINYQRFYGSLETALEAQQQRSVLTSNQLEAAREAWQQHYSREKNMEKLVKKKLNEEDMVTEKNSQREQDDRRRIDLME